MAVVSFNLDSPHTVLCWWTENSPVLLFFCLFVFSQRLCLFECVTISIDKKLNSRAYQTPKHCTAVSNPAENVSESQSFYNTTIENEKCLFWCCGKG